MEKAIIQYHDRPFLFVVGTTRRLEGLWVGELCWEVSTKVHSRGGGRKSKGEERVSAKGCRCGFGCGSPLLLLLGRRRRRGRCQVPGARDLSFSAHREAAGTRHCDLVCAAALTFDRP